MQRHPCVTPNVYGIDMPTGAELVAYDKTVEEVRQTIGCDALIYQDVASMKSAILAAQSAGSPHLSGFDASCFDGVYVTGDVSLEEILKIHALRPQADESQEDNSRLALPNPALE